MATASTASLSRRISLAALAAALTLSGCSPGDSMGPASPGLGSVFAVGAATERLAVLPAAPTIGNVVAFEGVDRSAPLRAMPFVAQADGSLESVTMFHEAGSGAMVLGVYAGETTPTTLLGTTAAAPVAPVQGWQTLPLEGPVAVRTGQTVWLAWLYERNPGVRVQRGEGRRSVSGRAWPALRGALPASFGSLPRAGPSSAYSIFATHAVPPASDLRLPPGNSWCTGACADAELVVSACALGATACEPVRRTEVAWTVNGQPVAQMSAALFAPGGVTAVFRSGPGYTSYNFAVATGASRMQLASDLDLTVSYYGLAPVWGGTTWLHYLATAMQGTGGISYFYVHSSYDPGVTHAQLAQRLDEIASLEASITGVTGPAYEAFLLPTEIAILLGGEGNLAWGDGTVSVNYGNPDFTAAMGGTLAVVSHEFSHENSHTLFSPVAQSLGWGSACLNEGLADALGNFIGYVPDEVFGRARNGVGDFSTGCADQTEVHSIGDCVLWNLKQFGELDAALLQNMFHPQHAYVFDSCDLQSPQTGDSLVVYLSESAGVDLSAFVASIGAPNSGSYDAAKAALGF